ncbi:HNH endonuclease signature motif containing protein [Microbacterium sp.]
MPAERCEIDHSIAWEDGGSTELANLHPLRLSHESAGDRARLRRVYA